ncbi:MAG TPA: hypothetical protein VHB70_01050 [Parafilimonas sp.]|nr:hypothetical protein [Parafilimonas sp.]
MKKILVGFTTIAIAVIITIFTNGCYESKKVADKSGAQLWAENCTRCHNAPPPGEFSNENWDIVGTHMQVRANITGNDAKKIIDFLKSTNTQ